MIEPKLLTPAQIAEALQLNESTITRWLRKGRLRGFKVGKDWRVSATDLDAFLEERANVPPSDRMMEDRKMEQGEFTGRSRKVRASKQ